MLIHHGRNDPVISVEFARAARQLLEGARAERRLSRERRRALAAARGAAARRGAGRRGDSRSRRAGLVSLRRSPVLRLIQGSAPDRDGASAFDVPLDDQPATSAEADGRLRSLTFRRARRASGRYANIRSCVGRTSRTERARRACSPGWVSRRSAPSTRPRRSASASTRSRRARRSTRCRSVADAVPLDDQPVPRMHPCVRLIYCFARPTHTYLDLNAREDFEREIVVKVNVPELVRAELGKRSWKGEHVALGTNTDPYQWVEGRYKLMPRDLGGDARLRQPVLDPHEVAAAAARHRADEGALRADGVRRQPLDPDARGEGVAPDRAAHAASAQADRGGRRAQRAPGSRSGC